MKTKDKIYIQDWLLFKPYENQTLTDVYYLKLCNNIKQAILSEKTSFIFYKYINKEEIDSLACFLCAWFEDLISDTNIWNSFIRRHKQMYKKPLPFYNLSEYYEEEINQQDICFLIWYFLNTVQTEKFIAPFNEFIEKTAEKVFTILDEAWDFAPENKLLKSIYTIDENETDFYIARNLIDTLLFKSYLFYPDTSFRLEEKKAEIIEENRDDENLIVFINENRDTTLHKSHTRLLSLKGKEWAAEILGKEHPLNKAYLNISQRIRGFFFYKGQDENDISLEHIASGKKFKLTKKSFDYCDGLKEIDTIMFMGIVKWRNEWWFSGIHFQSEFNADLVLKEKNSMESRMAVNFLDHQKDETREMLEKQYEAFLNFNNDSPIAFMPTDKLMDFNKNYIQFFNDSLNLSEKEINEAKERSRKDGFFGDEKEEPKDFTEIAETGLVFFNPKSGVEMVMEVNSAFPLSANPYFDKEESEDHIFRLFMDESISTELAMYCVDNCKTNLPFFQQGVGKVYLNDIDFLLRFWKKESYQSIPSITTIGAKED